MIPDPEILERMMDAASNGYSVLGVKAATLTPEAAAEAAAKYITEHLFEPLGDNHHNAAMCPHCRNGMALVALDPIVAKRFVDVHGKWTIEDEQTVLAAVREALTYTS